MQNPLRVCYANTVSRIRVNFSTDRPYTVTANTPTKVKDVLHILSFIPNVTEFALEPVLDGCIDRLHNNLSDVAAGDLVLADSGVDHKIPVPWRATTVYIVAAYNVTEYEDEQANRGRSFLGVLTNLGNFDASVYPVIMLMLMMFLLICLLDALIVSRKLKNINLYYRRHHRIRGLTNIMFHRMLRNRFATFLMSIAVFLIFTPFKCMYKTTQIVIDQPDFIQNYQDIIDRNASVHWSNLYADIPGLLKPSEDNIKRKDLVYRFYHHAMTHKPRASTRKVKSKQDIIEIIAQKQNKILHQKTVTIGDYVFTERNLAISCAMTFRKQFHRFFKFHDPNQSEHLTGFALRMPINNQKLLRNFRAIFESATIDVRETTLARYIYKDFKLNLATEEQYKKQKILCYEEHINFDKTQGIFTSDSIFFASIFFLALLIFTFAFIVLLIELKMKRRSPRRR